MPHKDPKRHAEYNGKYHRFRVELAADTELETAAAIFLRPKTPCIAFYRVFSKEPRAHNAGEAAQRGAVDLVVTGTGAELIGTYVQPEKSGPGQKKRPLLDAALAHCQQQGATLLIAKLGHLAASAPILSKLAASGVNFFACDRPKVNHLTIRKRAADAQQKEKAREEPRRAAWAALKANGYRPMRPTAEMTKRRLEVIYARSKAFTAEIYLPLQAARHTSRTLADIAKKLNDLDLTTRVGSSWNEVSVRRELKRAENLPQPSARQIAAMAKLLEGASRPALEKTDSPAVASAAPAAQGASVDPVKTGGIGRPTSRVLIETECRRCWAAGERRPGKFGGQSAEAWAKVLSDWLSKAHPDAPPMRLRAARGALAPLLRELERGSSSQNSVVAEITGGVVAEII